MEKSQVLEKLVKGEYMIERDSFCNCMCERISEENGVEIVADECWAENRIKIDGIVVARFVRYSSCEIEVEGIDYDELEDAIGWEELVEMQFSDEEEAHTKEQEAAMVQRYLEEMGQDAKFYKGSQCGISNDHVILISKSGAVEFVDELQKYAGASEITAEKAASEIVWRGDAAGKAYNGVVVL